MGWRFIKHYKAYLIFNGSCNFVLVFFFSLESADFQAGCPDEYMFGILISASVKKVPMRRWLLPEPHTIQGWTDIVSDIYVMGKKFCFLAAIRKVCSLNTGPNVLIQWTLEGVSEDV